MPVLITSYQTGGSSEGGDDGQADKLTGYSGDDWTLDFQPQLTSDPAQPDGGTDISPWTVTHDTNRDRATPDTLSYVTDQSVEVLGQPTETIAITYERIDW